MTVCCTVQLNDRTGLATDVDYPFEEWVGSGSPNTCGRRLFLTNLCTLVCWWGTIVVRMMSLLDIRASLPELVQRIAFTEEWLTGVVEKGGEEDAAVAPQRGGHVRLPQHHQSLWT